MKKFIPIMLATAASLLLYGCRKEDGVSSLEGTYTYKSSGTITVEGSYTDSEGEPHKETFILDLVPETGQMSLVRDSSSPEQLLAACNTLGGGAYSFSLTPEGAGEATITGTPRKGITYSAGTLLLNGSATVTFTGGMKRSSDVLIVNQKYSGSVTLLGAEMQITDSDVQCVAKLND